MTKLEPQKFNGIPLVGGDGPPEIVTLPKDAKLWIDGHSELAATFKGGADAVIEFDEGFLTTDQLDPQTVFAIEADNLKYEGQSYATHIQAIRHFEVKLTATADAAQAAIDTILEWFCGLDNWQRRVDELRAAQVDPWLGYAVMAALAILTAILVAAR